MRHALMLVVMLFAKLSLLALGGGGTVLGELQRQVVQHGWMTARQFAQAYGVSQAMPGSASLIAVPVGYRAAGLPGALAAFAAYLLPTCALALAVTAVWHRVRHSPWPAAVRTALMPVALGLFFGSAYALSRATVHSLPELVILAVVLLSLLRTKLPLIGVVAAAGAAGALFLR